MRDHVRAIIEQARVEARLADDRIGIEAEIAQRRLDLLGDTEMDVARRKQPPRPRRSLRHYRRGFPGTVARRHRHTHLADVFKQRRETARSAY